MIFRKTGPVSDRLYVTGLPWSPSYLFAGERPVLFEAGFHCMGKFYERDIKGVLGSRQPEMLFLSHVHWDHCGASAHLKRIFPGMKIAASRKAAAIMKRPNAVKLMERLSGEVIPLVEAIDGIDHNLLIKEAFEPFEVESVLEDGQTLFPGEESAIRVFSSPGHTSDLLSYYIPEEKILVATEAAGVLWQNGRIGTEFLVDFDDYMASMNRLAALDVRIFCQGHHFVFLGDQVKEFFERSAEAALRFKSEVEELLDGEDGSVDRVAAIMKAKEYDTNPGIKQAEQAYLLNLKVRVAHLAGRRARGSAQAQPTANSSEIDQLL